MREWQAAGRASNSQRCPPLVVALIAFTAGAALDRYWPGHGLGLGTFSFGSFGQLWLLSAVGLAVWLLLGCSGLQRLGLVALLLAVGALGASWHHAWWNLFREDDLGFFVEPWGQPVYVEVLALAEPSLRPAPPFDPLMTIPVGDRSRLPVQVCAIRDGDAWRPASGRALLWVEGRLPGIHTGDRLRVFASALQPKPAHNPGEFDYAAHARADRQLSLLRSDHPDCVTLVAPAKETSVKALLGKMRSASNKILWKQLSPDVAGLASALLLGQRDEVDPDRTEAFLTTGTIHILVVSGLNVGILVLGLQFLFGFGWVPRRVTLLLTGTLVVFYAILAGAEPPIVRAAVLVVVLGWGKLLGRQSLSVNSLAAAALVVVAINPAEQFRMGPQLSFLAVAVLIWLAGKLRQPNVDPLDRLIAQSRPWPERAASLLGKRVWQLTLADLAVWLAVLPLIMAQFHLVSPVAIVLGPVLWLPVTGALLAGYLVLLFGWLAPPLGTAAGWVCNGSLHAMEAIVTWAQAAPGSHYWVSGPETWWLVGFYGALGVVAVMPRLRPTVGWQLVLLSAWCAVGLGVSYWNQRGDQLRCTFVAVEHGAAVVLQLPNGKTLLYDAGRLGSPHAGARSIAACLWSQGIIHLDGVLISHADADHYNALPELLKRFSVGVVYVSPRMFENEPAAVLKLREAIEQAEIPIEQLVQGDRLEFDPQVRLSVLHPPSQGVEGSDNANSIVLEVQYENQKILLPGDLESPGIETLMAGAPNHCELLLAPHHGSRRSDPPGFARWTQPKWIVISGGFGRELDEVRKAYGQHGAKTLHTAEVGAVIATIRNGTVTVDAWLPR